MMRILTLCFMALIMPTAAAASLCHTFVDGPRAVPGVRYASLERVSASEAVRILYVTHSTYRIETPGGISIATDYSNVHGPGGLPTAVTMNHAHETHYTNFPDPSIEHVLRGWNPAGDGPAEHALELGDVYIRNVTTDIRGWGEPEKDGNSIFVFEVAEMCIGHLGHLHHELTDEQFAALGRMDILMVPVDGTWTMELAKMVELAKRLKSRIVLPMHYWGQTNLERFLAGMADEFAIDLREDPVLEVSFDSLPARPTVLVLPPVHVARYPDD